MARTAVVAGTASAVSGRVHAGQQASAQQKQQEAAAQEELRQMQLQAQIDAQVNARMAATQAAPAPAPEATPASARPPVDELYAQLTKLGELRQAGLLTDAEFAEQKARLLA